MKNNKGFTLIELLVVIGILAILLAITLIAINPAKQFAAANNTQRSSNVNAILNAVGQYQADNKGALPAGITSTPTIIGNGTGEINICAALVTQYMAGLPTDPLSLLQGAPITNCTTGGATGYRISKGASDNRVTVDAPLAENGATISVTR